MRCRSLGNSQNYARTRKNKRNLRRLKAKKHGRDITSVLKVDHNFSLNCVDKNAKTSQLIPNLNESDVTATTDLEKTENFPKFFSSVFTRELPACCVIENSATVLIISVESVFSQQEVLLEMSKRNVNKSIGPDKVSARVLFEMRHEVVKQNNAFSAVL